MSKASPPPPAPPAESLRTGAQIAAVVELSDRAAERTAGRGRYGRKERTSDTVGVVLARLDDLDVLPDLRVEVRAALDAVEERHESLRRARAVVEKARTGLVEAIVGGDAGVLLAPSTRDIASMMAALEQGGVVSVAVGHAASVLWRAAVARLKRAAVPVIWPELVRVVAGAVDTSVALAAKVPGDVRDAAGAFDAGRAEEWSALESALEAWTAAHDVVGELRRAGWLPGLAAPSGEADATPDAWLRYGDPSRLPNGYRRVHPLRKLATAVRAGAGPGLYAASDADRRHGQHVAKARRARAKKWGRS